MLSVKDVEVELGAFCLSGVDFTVKAGNYFVLLGESGAGKTVLLELIAGLLTPARGSIMLDGRDLAGIPIQKRHLGLVYQDQALFPHLTVRSNIGYAFSGEARDRVQEIAARVGATDLLDRKPTTLSLGEAQRVALEERLQAEQHREQLRAAPSAGATTAAVLMGAKVPIVLTSRADTDRSKLFSIALAASMEL